MPKISQLPILTNINTGSIIPIVDNSRTQRISVGKLYEFLSGALDETFSTEFELMQSASAITSSLENLSASLNTTITNITVGSASPGTVSSSNQITTLGFAKTGSNTFSGSQTILAGNSLLVNRIENTTGGNIEIAASGLLTLSGDGGGVTTNDNFESNPGGANTFKVTSGSVSITGSIYVTGTPIISGANQIANLGFATTSSVVNVNTSSLLTTASFTTFSSSINQRVIDATNEQILNNLATTASNTFSGSQTILAGNSLLVNRIENTTGGNIEIAAAGLLSLSGDGGGVTTNDNFEANPGGNATFKVTSGSVSITGSISATGTPLISSSTQITALGFISESITDTGSLLLTSSFNTFSSSVHQRLLSATNEQVIDGFLTTSSFNTYTSSNNTKVNSLVDKTGSFATTGSNTFIDENVFQQKVTVNHDFIVTGSSLFGSGNFNEIAPEKFLVVQNDPTNYNIIVAKAETNNYSQILVTNLSNGISASSDIVAQADNGGETNMYADLGVNSSGYTGNGNGVGAANDAYVYGKAKNFYVGTLTTQSLYLFANESGSPEVILKSNVLTISASVLFSGSISASSYIGLPIGLVSSSAQITNLGYATTSSLAVVTPFLSSSDFNTFTSSYKTDSGSFDSRITAIVNTGAPAGTVSSSQQITNLGFATTSSLAVVTPFLSSSAFETYTSSNETKWNTIGNLTGSFITEAETGSFLTSIPNGIISSSAQITIQPSIYNGAATEIISANGGYLELKTNDGNNSVSIGDSFVTIYSNSNFWRFNTDGEFVLPDGTTQTTAFTGIPNGSISSSQQIVDLGFSTTGSNTFRNNQIISGNLNVEGAISASSLQVTTFYAVSSSVSSTSGSTAFGTENTDVMSVTGSVRATNEISASTINGLGNATQYSASVSNRIDGNGNRLTAIETTTSSLNVFTSSTNTALGNVYIATSSLNTFTASVIASGSILNTFTSSINSFTASVRASGSIINTFTQSVNTFTSSLVGAITTSAQITAFGFATTSSVVNVNTSSLVTTSSFNTFTSSYKTDSASFDSRITAGGGGSVPAGTVSSSAQVTAYGFLLTSSFNTYTASAATAVSAAINTATASLSASNAVIDGLQLATSSFNTYTSSVNNTTASLNRFTASAATTASNTFVGNQIISGAVTMTSTLAVSSTVINDISLFASSSSLILTSGSALIITSGGYANISGSVVISGSLNVNGVDITGAGGGGGSTDVSMFLSQSIFNTFATSSNNFTSSVNSTTASLNTFSSSVNSFSSSINTYTASLKSTTLISSSTQITNLGFATTSSVLSIDTSSLVTTSSFNGFSSSVNSTTSSLNSYTSSNDGKWNTLGGQTGSFITEAETGSFVTNVSMFLSKSTFESYTSSNESKWSNLGGQTGSFITEAETGSFVTNVSMFLSKSAFDVYTSSLSGVVSSSQQITNFGFATTSSVLNVDTSSLVITSSFNSFSSSVNSTTASLNSFTASVATTSSINTLTASFIAFSSSVNTTTSSLNSTTASLNRFTASAVTTSSFNSLTSSFNTFSSSINTFSASVNGKTGSFATTASNQFNGNQSITGSLIVSSVAVVSASFGVNSSSLTLSSGSNLYIQNDGYFELSGSALISGALNVIGNTNLATTASINTLTASFTAFSSSVNTSTASLNTFSSSVNTFTASVNTTTSSLNTFSSSVNSTTESLNIFSASVIATGSIINTFSSSVNSATSSLYSFSASINTSTASLNVFSASVIATGSIINTFTSSVNSATSSLYSFTASVNSTTSSLNSKTGSYATTGSNLFTGSQSISGSLNVSGSVTINNSRIDTSWTAYTPQWTAASSNPVINNGTIEGYYKVIGKTCFVRGNIAMGSTTTFGSGEWYVSMPFTASHADAILMTVTLLDNGTAWYNATMVGARAGFNYKAPIQYQTTGGTAGDVNATGPFTWTTSDRFIWNGSYEIL